MRVAPEGWPFILGAAVLTVIVFALLRNAAAVLPALLTVFMIFFFRDPERPVPAGENLFVAPADGKVIVIRDAQEPEFIKGKAKQISIFMSPLDVHVNRSPADGRVTDVVHRPGGFAAAFAEDASERNERTSLVLSTAHGTVVSRQVAGWLARRIVCRVGPGEVLARGQRYGLIKFSSRVDLFVPAGAVVEVSLNDRVKAGETVVARMP